MIVIADESQQSGISQDDDESQTQILEDIEEEAECAPTQMLLSPRQHGQPVSKKQRLLAQPGVAAAAAAAATAAAGAGAGAEVEEFPVDHEWEEAAFREEAQYSMYLQQAQTRR